MSKTLRKLGAIFTSSVVLSTMMVGCGSDSTTSASSNGDVTLTYAIWDKNQEAGMQSIIDAFEEENPGINVNLEITPWEQYWTKLEAAATGDVMPDVFWMHANQINRYAGGDMLLGLTDMIEDSSTVDMKKFPEGLVNLYTVDSENYGIPKDFDTVALWYNKTLFDEAGLSYPDETWTWDDLLNAAKTLTNKETGVYGIAANANAQEGYYNFVHQNGGEIIVENEDGTKTSGYSMDETKEALKWYTNLSLEEGVSPSNTQMSDTAPGTLFQSGKVAMMFAGSWMVSEFASYDYVVENCDVAVLPQGKERGTVYNGLANSVSANTKHKEEALKFIEFLGGEEAAKIQSESGVAIAAYEGTQDAWAKAYPEFNLSVYPDMMDYGTIFAYSKNKSKWEETQTEVMRKIFEGSVSVEDGCDQIAEKMNEVLAAE